MVVAKQIRLRHFNFLAFGERFKASKHLMHVSSARNSLVFKYLGSIKLGFSFLLAICGTLMVACDHSQNAASGGGAGDLATNPRTQEAITLLQPFVGVYDLQDDWLGRAGDEAFLSIRLTGNDGVSEAALIDFDDVDNCVPQRLHLGVVQKDTFSDRVFLDDILQFTDAELSLSGNNLTIQTTDLFDIDNDLDTSESITVQATRLDVTETDLGSLCQ